MPPPKAERQESPSSEPIRQVLQGGRAANAAPAIAPDDADPFAAFESEPDVEPFEPSPDESFVPEGFDLFEIDPEKLEALRAKKIDPALHAVRIYPVTNGRRTASIGTYPAHGLSARWFRATFPPGTYDLQGLNRSGCYVAGKRYEQPGIPGAPGGPRAFGAAPQSWDALQNAGAGGVVDQILAVAVQRMLAPPATENPLGDLVKVMAAQSSMMSQAVQVQMQVMAAQQTASQNSPDSRAQSQIVDLMKAQAAEQSKLLGMLLATRNAPAAKSAGGNDLDTMMRVLQFGMSIKGGKSTAPPQDDPKWVELVIGLAENLGPGVVAVLAQATLPEDRARFVCDVLEQHQKARAAEAAADARTVDVEGEPVPE